MGDADKVATSKHTKHCDFCGLTVLSGAFAKHLKSNVHINNQDKFYRELKFSRKSDPEEIKFNKIANARILVDNSEMNMHKVFEDRYVIQCKEKNIILDKYQETDMEGFAIGVRYLTNSESEFFAKIKNKSNIIGKQVFMLDLIKNIATVTSFYI